MQQGGVSGNAVSSRGRCFAVLCRRIFAAVFLLALSFLPLQTALGAAPASNLSTLASAIGGNAGAGSALNADLGGNYGVIETALLNHYDPIEFDVEENPIPRTPAEEAAARARAAADIQRAVSGNAADMTGIQQIINGSLKGVEPPFQTIPGYTQNMAIIAAGSGTPVTPGVGSYSLITMRQALEGNALAKNLLTEGMGGAAVTDAFLESLPLSIGGGTSGTVAGAISAINAALAGNPAAIADINLMVNSYTSSALSGLLNSSGFSLVSNLTNALPAPPVTAEGGADSTGGGTGETGTESADSGEDTEPPPEPDNEPPHTLTTGGPAAVGSTLNNPCGGGGAALTGDFATDPCKLTRDNRGIEFAQNYYGGEQLTDYLEKWWTQDFLPALKSMTSQLHASRIDQTRQIGAMLDAQDTSHAARDLQQRELQNKLNTTPSELSCTAGSYPAALSQSTRLSNALAQGFKEDVGRRSNNVTTPPPSITTTEGATETESGSGAGPSPLASQPKPIDPALDQKDQWETYCREFHDPDNNNGVSACPNPTEPGATKNGDIDVEGFLLADTIDLSDDHEYEAAAALIKNIIQPKITEQIPDAAVNTAIGHEWILKKQHQESVLNIATEIITSIISRRTAIPTALAGAVQAPTSVPMVSPASNDAPLPATAAAPANGSTPFTLQYVKDRLGNLDYRRLNASGKVEMTFCQKLVSEASKKYSNGGSAKESYYKLKNMGVMQPPNQALIQPGDLVYMESGSPNGKQYGHTGVYADGGEFISVLNTVKPMSLTSWINSPKGGPLLGFVKFADIRNMTGTSMAGNSPATTETGTGSGTETTTTPSAPPSPPTPVGELIKQIRVKAGIPEEDIAEEPSYNEIMLAMTKERFFDPEYFVRMHDNLGAIKQEQAALEAYISMQYQDIYNLQEQINALLSARAALKFNADTKANQVQASPLK
jgi:hypothetical protein